MDARKLRRGPADGRIAGTATDDSAECESDDDGTARAYRLLRFLKVVSAILATALTIARTLGWL